MSAYYNENDPFAAAWLRELIAKGLIAAGDVDERSIADVRPDDLRSYTQCHFFAGIGGWSLALRLARWDDTRPVWTGSCPCQPFSAAGKRKGTADKRHLWPEFRRLIAECSPPVVFGEQVASKDGRLWLSGVRTDLEALGYAVGAADLCSAGVGAPHIRQRLWWLADADGQVQSGLAVDGEMVGVRGCGAGGLGHAEGFGRHSSRDDNHASRRPEIAVGERSAVSGLGDSDLTRSQGRGERLVECAHQWPLGTPNLAIRCTDGKTRRTQSGIFPLAHGVSNRVGKLRGAGNAINAWLAAEFILASQGAVDAG